MFFFFFLRYFFIIGAVIGALLIGLVIGYFIGKLTRNKVCPLYTSGVELPSDLHGLLYIEIDQEESWKFKLAKELKATGFDIDVNKIL